VVDDARLGLAQGHFGKASFLASPVHLQTAGQAVRAPVSVELRASQASAPSPAWPAVSPSEELRSARPPHPFHCALHHHCFERGARCRHALTLGCALRVFYPFSPAASGPAPRHILLLFWTLHATALQQPPLIRYSNGNRETLLTDGRPLHWCAVAAETVHPSIGTAFSLSETARGEESDAVSLESTRVAQAPYHW
jgi:hypothetical protein